MAGDRPVRSGVEPPEKAALWSDGRPGEVDWEYLYEHYADSLRRLIARRLPRDGPVDDLLQETFFRAIRSTPLIDTTRATWPFLATVAGRAVADWWSRESTRRALSSPREHVPERQVTGEFPGSDDHAIALDRRIRARRALLALTPRHRRALFLYEAADCSYETLVELDPVTPQAMRSLVGRARTCFVEQYRRLALALVVWRRTIASRVRARLERLSSVPLSSEGLSALGGVVVVTLVAGVTTLPFASATSTTQRVHRAVAARQAGAQSDTEPMARSSPVERSTMEHAGVDPPQPLARGERSSSPHERLPVVLNAGGGVTNTPEASTVSFSITITHPLIGGEQTVGTTTRCDQGEVAAHKCRVLRSLPENN